MRAPRSYRESIASQPELLDAILAAPRPAWLTRPAGTLWIVGIGTNRHAAELAAWLWREAGLDARAVNSHDYAALPPRLRPGDRAVFLSHRGTKSATLAAEAAAREAGARTVAIAGDGAPWRGPSRFLYTGPQEPCGCYAQSLTGTLAWLLRWAGRPSLLAPLRGARAALRWGPRFPKVRRGMDLVFVGDGPREWVAREACLKVLETCWLPARAFGLEEFLHGPRISTGKGTLVLAFSAPGVPRWKDARRYLSRVGAKVVDVGSKDWLRQLLWAQRFALSACEGLGQRPEELRTGDPRYAAARRALKL